LFGYAQVLCARDLRAGYGGLTLVLGGIAAETVFTLLLDAISVVGKTGTTIRLLLGMPTAWLPQNRGDRGVPWVEAARLLWPHTAIGLLAFTGFAQAGWQTVLWAAPLAGGLVLSIPFCVLTAAPRFGAWLRRHRIAATPEEATMPQITP